MIYGFGSSVLLGHLLMITLKIFYIKILKNMSKKKFFVHKKNYENIFKTNILNNPN